eukprot:NODE_718_length_4825_cov_0.832840.p3 type:complete len:101 gc:universal NODE_718_length_4825_cov_0.832840:3758-4060(+)
MIFLTTVAACVFVATATLNLSKFETSPEANQLSNDSICMVLLVLTNPFSSNTFRSFKNSELGLPLPVTSITISASNVFPFLDKVSNLPVLQPFFIRSGTI